MAFSAKTIEFLMENRLRNSKEWYDNHKAQYREYVLEPLQQLSAALGPELLKIDPMLTIDPTVGRTISRIRRDTRFSKDKSLYRENMWIIFKRGRMYGTEVPGIYFELGPEGFEYGGGFYDASPQYMETLRRLVLEGGKEFQQANKALELQERIRITGEVYKRPHYPQKEENLRTWLERRKICFTAQSTDFDLLFSDGLADFLKKDFGGFAPIYHFLLYVSEQNRNPVPVGTA